MGWTDGTESCAEGHHGTSLDVPWYPLETEGWDREVGQRVLVRDTMGHVLWCPLGTEGWDGQVGRGVLLRKFVSTA